jgi:hypothetical protein
MLQKIKKIIELSIWFNRKSQHYILGDWTVYIPWRSNFKRLFDYYRRYPIAYIKFMWLSRFEIMGTEKRFYFKPIE